MKHVIVDEQYQIGYEYDCEVPIGKGFAADFSPELSPEQMLKMGIFGGNYFKSIPGEFPGSWFDGVELSASRANPELNYFKVNASQSLQEWQRKGWIYEEDPLGWFLWYCRYYCGRRIPDEDAKQIKRWRAIKRHVAQIKHSCEVGDLNCRPRQRQALLHWAYDSTKI